MPLVKSTETGEMVGTVEASRMLGIVRGTVIAMAERGELTGARRIGRNWQIPLKEVHKQLGIFVTEEEDITPTGALEEAVTK